MDDRRWGDDVTSRMKSSLGKERLGGTPELDEFARVFEGAVIGPAVKLQLSDGALFAVVGTHEEELANRPSAPFRLFDVAAGDDDAVEFQRLALVRPVRLAFFHRVFDQIGQHNYRANSLLPNHLPEIRNRLLYRSLRRDVPPFDVLLVELHRYPARVDVAVLRKIYIAERRQTPTDVRLPRPTGLG